MPKFVCPIPNFMRNSLLEYNRLYAYPVIPEIDNKNLIILDSGAFALFMQKKQMNYDYLNSLSNHYEKYYQKNVKCVAPDTFLNYKDSIKKFELWHYLNLFEKICPVIQMPEKRNFDENIINYQLDYYSSFYQGNIEFLFYSNPSCRAIEYPKDLFLKMKDKYCIEWIHNLGAGWDKSDIIAWSYFKGLDSIDTIAYYNATYSIEGNWMRKIGNKKEIAFENVRFANNFLK